MSGVNNLFQGPAAPRVDRAVILGGSLAGLLAAAAVSRFAASITILDRDDLVDALTTPRRGTPQAVHSHALLVGGLRAMESLLPGFTKLAVSRGAISSDLTARTEYVVDCHRLIQSGGDDRWLVASRTLIESCVRQLVSSLDNVTLRGHVDIVDLVSDDHWQVNGVAIRNRNGTGSDEVVRADLVIDASGKKPRTLAWLRNHGREEPREDLVTAGIRYSTKHFRAVPGILDDLDCISVPPYPGSTHAGIALRHEGGIWSVTLGGRFGRQAPSELAEFSVFARELPTKSIARIVESCPELGETQQSAFPVSRWRHWEELKEPLNGLVVIGDAVAAVNPTVGQGMTMAAQQAVALRDVIQKDGFQGIELRSAKALAEIVRAGWEIGTIDDLIEMNPGSASTLDRLLDMYLGRAVAIATRRPEVAHALLRVFHLDAPTTSLIHPAVAWAVLGPGTRAIVRAAAEEQTSLKSSSLTVKLPQRESLNAGE